jgi:hypothetical protein
MSEMPKVMEPLFLFLNLAPNVFRDSGSDSILAALGLGCSQMTCSWVEIVIPVTTYIFSLICSL